VRAAPDRVDPVLLAMRRRSIRLPANGNVRVEMPNTKVKLERRDLGFGGFAIVAPRPFCKGLTHWFSFASGMGDPVTLVAKAVHCQALADCGLST
jgi:hypothetical protein